MMCGDEPCLAASFGSGDCEDHEGAQVLVALIAHLRIVPAIEVPAEAAGPQKADREFDRPRIPRAGVKLELSISCLVLSPIERPQLSNFLALRSLLRRCASQSSHGNECREPARRRLCRTTSGVRVDSAPLSAAQREPWPVPNSDPLQRAQESGMLLTHTRARARTHTHTHTHTQTHTHTLAGGGCYIAISLVTFWTFPLFGIWGLSRFVSRQAPLRAFISGASARGSAFVTHLVSACLRQPQSAREHLVTFGVCLSPSAPRRTFISGASASGSRCVPFTAAVRSLPGCRVKKRRPARFTLCCCPDLLFGAPAGRISAALGHSLLPSGLRGRRSGRREVPALAA